MAKRITYHNGRSNKQGVYSAKHNDRQFDIKKAEHIKAEEADNNIYWHCYQDINPELSFEAVEQKYYIEHFSKYLELRNKKSIKQGHKERVQSIEDYRKSRKSCVEETIFQLGNKLDSVSREKLNLIIVEFLRWKNENYPQCVTLDIAYHADEQGAGHIHERHIWLAHDDAGREMVNQGDSLKEMGVERPEPAKKEGRYNNAKMTYTQKSREKLAEISRSWGVEIEEKPREASKSGQDLLAWQVEQDKIKADMLNAELQKTQELYNENIIKAEIYLSKINAEAEAEKKKAEEYKALAEAENKRIESLRVADVELEAEENARRERLKKLTLEANSEEERAKKAKARAKKRKEIETIRKDRILEFKEEYAKIQAEADDEKQEIIKSAKDEAEIILKPIKEEIIPAIVAVDTAMKNGKGVQNAVKGLWVTIKSTVERYPHYFVGVSGQGQGQNTAGGGR